jgi:multiple sugar transport system substrate-binding protein
LRYAGETISQHPPPFCGSQPAAANPKEKSMGLTQRRSVLALAGTTVVSLALAACGGGGGGGGGGGTNGAGKTLDVFVGTNTQFPEQIKAWRQDIGNQFKSQTGATVKWEEFASANDEITKIETSVVSGSGPDIYGVGTTMTPTAYATGAFVKLDDAAWQKVGGKSRFLPATLGISGPDANNQIGIPWATRPFVMAYNKDLLKAAGITKPATTWDELGQQAKKLTHGDQYGLAVAYKDNFDPWKFAWGMSIQAGNPLVQGKTAKIDDPTVKKAYQTYFGWLTKDHVVNPAAVGWTNTQALAEFTKGKTGYFALTTPTSLPTLDASPLKGKWAYALLPTVPPGMTSRPANAPAAASILSGDNLVVADYSKNQDLALALIKLMTDDQNAKSYWEKLGQPPTNAAVAQTALSDPKLAPVLEAAKQSVATPFTGAWGSIQLALTNVAVQAIPNLAKGSVPDSQLDSLLADAQKSSQQALDKAK